MPASASIRMQFQDPFFFSFSNQSGGGEQRKNSAHRWKKGGFHGCELPVAIESQYACRVAD